MKRTVAVVTLGCTRNEVDSEELAGRLLADGWTLVDDVESAEVALVNTVVLLNLLKRIQLMLYLKLIRLRVTVSRAQLWLSDVWLSVMARNLLRHFQRPMRF